MYRSTAGETVSTGKADGPGVALTAVARYLAPPLLGLGAAALLAVGHLTGMLLLSLVLLAGLAVAVQRLRHAGRAGPAGDRRGRLRAASAVVQAGFGYAMRGSCCWAASGRGSKPAGERRRAERR